jgi:hypothetical protein
MTTRRSTPVIFAIVGVPLRDERGRDVRQLPDEV